MKPLLFLASLLAFSCLALAGGTSHWVHTNEADFKKGKFHGTVATNLGDVKLSRALKTLLEQDPRVSSVYCLAEGPDGSIYAGTGPHGIVLQVKGDRVSTLATLEDENVFSILVEKDGRILVGTGGEKGRILRLNKPGEKPAEVFSADGVQYVWAMQQTPDGSLYAGTGAKGQIFEIKSDGAKSVLMDSDETNILSLLSDGRDTLYAGTDPNGLVYRINRKTKEVFVLFDAPEAEVSCLALDAKGNLYAGTGQAPEGEDKEMEDTPGAAEKLGRPEGGDSAVPLPSKKPAEPKPPVLPRPNEPDPIPRDHGAFVPPVPSLAVSPFGCTPPVRALAALDLMVLADFDAPTTQADGNAPAPAPVPNPPAGPTRRTHPPVTVHPMPNMPVGAPRRPATPSTASIPTASSPRSSASR